MDSLNCRLSTRLQLSNQWGQTRLILIKQCFIVLLCQDFNQWSLTLLILY